MGLKSEIGKSFSTVYGEGLKSQLGEHEEIVNCRKDGVIFFLPLDLPYPMQSWDVDVDVIWRKF
jgi:hypothetical protein